MKIDLRRFRRVSSTQDICRDMAQRGAEEGVVIVADEQVAGRGRAGYDWYSPPGQAIYASILLHPHLTISQVSWITMMAALAVTDALGVLGPSPLRVPTIKWLNDVMLADKKVCGILVETAMTNDQLDYAILGIGLNVNTDFANAPDGVRMRATSLRESWGLKLDCDTCLTVLLEQVSQHYDVLMSAQRSPAYAYAQRLDTLGKWVRIQSGDDIIEGLAYDIDALGGLCVRTGLNDRTVYFGHVLSAVSPQ